MKRMNKFLVVMLIFACLATDLFAGGAKDLNPTEQEKKDGWRYFMPIGFKLKRPEFFTTYRDNVESNVLGSEDDELNNVIYSMYEYSFFSDEANVAYDAIVDNKNLSKEEKGKKIKDEVEVMLKKVYALAVLRTPLIGDKKLEEITGFPHNEIIRKTKKFTQILSISEFSNDGLSEKSAQVYKTMIEQVRPVISTITCVDPRTNESAMLAIKGLKFETVDLDGKPVTNDVFKDYDVTMINVWATWCPPCRAELPELGKLYESYRDKKVNILGLTLNVKSDAQDASELAKKLTSEAGCKYTILQNNDSFNYLIDLVPAYPTSFFVDKNGNVIGSAKTDIIIGSRNLEEFTQAVEKALKTVK